MNVESRCNWQRNDNLMSAGVYIYFMDLNESLFSKSSSRPLLRWNMPPLTAAMNFINHALVRVFMGCTVGINFKCRFNFLKQIKKMLWNSIVPLVIHILHVWYLNISKPNAAVVTVHCQPETLTSESSFWDSPLRRSLGCICNGRQSPHRALRPDSLLIAALYWLCSEPLGILSCSKPQGKTTDRPPNTPTCRCHLEGRGGRII